MSNVESTRIQPRTIAEEIDASDSAVVLMVLWSMQVDILKDSMLANFAGTVESQKSLNQVGGLVYKVTAIHIETQNTELNSVSWALRQLQNFQQQIIRKIFIAPRNLSNILSWSRQRGLPFVSINSGALSFNWFKARKAMDQNVGEIRSYIDQVQSNTADNDRLRNHISNAPGLNQIIGQLKQLGHPDRIRSLRDLVTVGTSLSVQLHSIQRDLSLFTKRIRVLGEEAQRKSNEISSQTSGFLKKSAKDEQQKSEEEKRDESVRQLKQELRLLEDLDLRRDLLDELLDSILALEVLEDLRKDKITETQRRELSNSAAFEQASRQAQRWQNNLNQQLSSISLDN
ncbi:MAG: hypothetical protein AAF483_09980 [Planctomycetota bacterium]